MKKTKPAVSQPSQGTVTGVVAASPSAERQEKEQPVEVDRRGKPLPARQRVGGIITPQ